MKFGHFRRVALVAEFSVRSRLHFCSGPDNKPFCKIRHSSGMPKMVHPKTNQPTNQRTNFPRNLRLHADYEAIYLFVTCGFGVDMTRQN